MVPGALCRLLARRRRGRLRRAEEAVARLRDHARRVGDWRFEPLKNTRPDSWLVTLRRAEGHSKGASEVVLRGALRALLSMTGLHARPSSTSFASLIRAAR